jgi:uncharacterized protein YbcV (DUF1398 family)
MFDKNIIMELCKQAVNQDLPFQKFFTKLKEAEVRAYEVDVALCQIIYFGNNEVSFQQPLTDLYPNLLSVSIASTYDKNTLIKTLQKDKSCKSYEVFLHDLAAAGVARYRVDLAQRTVSYYGDHQVYVEHIPHD